MRVLEHNCLKFFQPLSCLRQALQTRRTFSIAYPNRQIFFLSKKLSDISLSAGWFCIFSLALFFSFCFVFFFLLIDVKMYTKTLRRTYSGVFLNLPLLPLHRCLSEKKKTSVSCSKKCPNIIVTAPRQLGKIKTLLCSKCQLPLGNLRPSSLGIKSTYRISYVILYCRSFRACATFATYISHWTTSRKCEWSFLIYPFICLSVVSWSWQKVRTGRTDRLF